MAKVKSITEKPAEEALRKLARTMNQEIKNKLVDAYYISAQLGFSIETIRKWVQNKTIPHHRFGKRCVRFNPIEVEKWLKTKHVEAREGGGRWA